MKTAILYKTLVLVMLPTLILANNSKHWKGKHTKTKTINKEYSVNSDATVKIINKYGNLDVVTWNENRVVFEITITTNGNNEEKVIKKLDDISVNFEASPSNVSVKTILNKNKSNSWWSWASSSKVNMKINYIVKIPTTNNVNLSNNYGNINLDKLEGHAKINCDYGKITTKELMADNNLINFDYTNHSYFEYIKSGSINADYSDFTIAKTNNININADYTKSNIEIAEDIVYDCDYGGIIIDKANNIKGDSDYLTTIIGDVYKSVSINSDYGSIKIKRLNKNTNNVTITSDYTGIKIGYDPSYNFSFDIDLKYASLRDYQDLEFNKKNKSSSKSYYSGYKGNSNSNNLIKISSDYGSVSLYKN